MDTTPFPIKHSPPPVNDQTNEQVEKQGIMVSTGRYLQFFFLTMAILMVVFQPRTDVFTTFAIIFSSIVLEAFPFMLLGTLLGGFVEVFLGREQLMGWLPKSKWLAIVAAAFMGILFPVCECAIVPVVRKFIHKGLPLGSAVAFLLGGPIVNPLVFGSTLVAYSFSFETAFLRFIAGAGIAIGIGMLIDSVITEDQALVPALETNDLSCCHAGCSHEHDIPLSLPGKLWSAVSHGAADFYDIGRFLIIGAFIAASLQTLVPRTFFLSVTDGPMIAIIAMMGLAVVLNLCSEADAFIAASFQPLGIPFSAQLAFMVMGPMLDIKLILMYLSVFTRKMILVLIFSICIFVFTTMAALEVSQWFVN